MAVRRPPAPRLRPGRPGVTPVHPVMTPPAAAEVAILTRFGKFDRTAGPGLNFKVPFITFSVTSENLWIDELARANPYTHNVMINRATAEKKGIKDGDRILIDNLSFTLPRNGIVGVIGPNGVGKTTLFRMIVAAATNTVEDDTAPTDGSLKIGETVKLSYVDQSRAGLDATKNVWEVVSDGLDWIKVGNVEMPSRAYVSVFGFKGPDQQKQAKVLSGGERNRLNLALTLKMGGNLLLLDEPTNDLDVETLGSLENALLDFPGCAVITSHDRWFLDRIATHILAYEGDSQWFWFEGNFESYEKNKIERLGIEAARPHRATYRKLTRG